MKSTARAAMIETLRMGGMSKKAANTKVSSMFGSKPRNYEPTRNDMRRVNYAALRSAGFTKVEAERLKGAGLDKVRHAAAFKELPPPIPRKATAKKGQGQKLDSFTVGKDNVKHYMLKWTYLVSYTMKIDGHMATEYIHIVSDTRKPKSEVIAAARDILINAQDENNEKRYKGTLRVGSIRVVAEYHNPESKLIA